MKKYVCLCVCVLSLCLGGCNWLDFPVFVLFGQTHERVKAEYTQLEGKKVAIIIASLPAIDFEDPYARMDLALASAEWIRREVKEVQFVEQETVERFLKENLDWVSMPMSEIAEQFGANRILYIELMQFTTEEPESVNLVRGRGWAQVSVYETDSPSANVPVYQTEIQVVYPEQGPLPMSDTARIAARQQILVQCAGELARKFYNHKRKTR